MGSLYAIAEGIGGQQDANLNAQISTALQGIMLAPGIVTLNQMYMELLAEDALNYANATAVSFMSDDEYHQGKNNKNGKDLGLGPNYNPEGDPLKGLGPHMAAIAAYYNVQKGIHQQEGDLRTGEMQSMVETIKSNVVYLGQNLEEVFRLTTPILQFLTESFSQLGRIK